MEQKFLCKKDLFMFDEPQEQCFTKGKVYSSTTSTKNHLNLIDDQGDDHVVDKGDVNWIQYFEEIEV